jgi:hypothetical protein
MYTERPYLRIFLQAATGPGTEKEPIRNRVGTGRGKESPIAHKTSVLESEIDFS